MNLQGDRQRVNPDCEHRYCKPKGATPMTFTVIVLVACSIVMDVIGQLCFKLGLDRLPELEGGFRLNAFWGQVFNAPLLWCGIGAFVVEFLVWLEALSRAPLSLLFPAAALAYCGVVLASR
jgi:hypothetical protein